MNKLIKKEVVQATDVRFYEEIYRLEINSVCPRFYHFCYGFITDETPTHESKTWGCLYINEMWDTLDEDYFDNYKEAYDWVKKKFDEDLEEYESFNK